MAPLRFLTLGFLLAAPVQGATTLTVAPTKDSFTSGLSGDMDANFGAAGALTIAGSAVSNTKGPADTFMTFNVSSIVSSFNTAYGVGGWALTSAQLLLTEKTNPNNPTFNNNASGAFEIRWIANDSYSQGTGNPGATRTDGITWNTEANYLTPGTDVSVAMATYSSGQGTNGQKAFDLSLIDPAFLDDLMTGSQLSFYLTGGNSATAFTFNSTDYTGANPPAATSKPFLSLTATAAPEPSRALLLLTGLGLALGHRLRRSHLT